MFSPPEVHDPLSTDATADGMTFSNRAEAIIRELTIKIDVEVTGVQVTFVIVAWDLIFQESARDHTVSTMARLGIQ